MSSAGTVGINFIAKFERAVSGIKNVEHSVSGLESAIHQIKGIGAGLFALESVQIAKEAFATLKETILEVVESATTMAAKADAIGVTAASLSQLEHSARMADIPFEALTKSLQKMNVNLGSGKIDAQIQKLGLSIQQLKSVDATTALGMIGDKLKAIPNAAERAAAAQAIFGKGAAEILPLLLAGSEGINKWAKESDAFGKTLSGLDVEKLREADDSFDRMTALIEGIKKEIVVALAPAIEAVLTAFQKWWSEGQRGLNTIKGIVTLSTNIVNGLGKAWSYVGGSASSALDMILARLIPFYDQLRLLFTGLEALGQATQKINQEEPPLAKAVEVVEEVQAVVVDVTSDIDKLTDAWATELETQGMSRREAELWKLVSKGATYEQIEGLRQLQAEIEKVEAAEKARVDAEKAAAKDKEDLKNAAKRIIQESMTDFDKMAEKIEEINRLEKDGYLSSEQAQRARTHAMGEDKSKDDDPATPDEPKHHKFQFAEAAQLGSAASRSAYLSASFGGKNQAANQTANNTKTMTKQLGQLVQLAQKPQQKTQFALN